MDVRRATEADREVLLALWAEFAAASFPAWAARAGVAAERRAATIASWRAGTAAELGESIRAGAAFVAEETGELLGFAAAIGRGPTAAELLELYVRPGARGGGVATTLVRAVVAAVKELGAEHVVVATAVDNEPALAAYERWGFRPQSLQLVAPVADLELRLGLPD